MWGKQRRTALWALLSVHTDKKPGDEGTDQWSVCTFTRPGSTFVLDCSNTALLWTVKMNLDRRGRTTGQACEGETKEKQNMVMIRFQDDFSVY